MEEKQEQFLERIRKDFNEYKENVLANETKEDVFNLAYKIVVIRNFVDGIESFMAENIQMEKEIIEKTLNYKNNLMEYFWEDFENADYDLNKFFKEWINELPRIVEESLKYMGE